MTAKRPDSGPLPDFNQSQGLQLALPGGFILLPNQGWHRQEETKAWRRHNPGVPDSLLWRAPQAFEGTSVMLRGPQSPLQISLWGLPKGSKAIDPKDRVGEGAQAAQEGTCQSRLKAWLWGQQVI